MQAGPVDILVGEPMAHMRTNLLDKLHTLTATKQPNVQQLMEEKALLQGHEDAFFVCDLGSIVRQHHKWQRLLPRVEPFYAIKCNTDPEVLRTLIPLTSGFDCASKGEIETMLALGVNPADIIYANPCKPPDHIRYARDRGVNLMTFDNADELAKVKAINPTAKMVLRVLTDDSKSVCRFGTKFGAHLPATFPLLQTARHLGLEVVGVSFHVGSGCQDPMAFEDAVRRARKVFDEGAMLGFKFTLLDVGGGFPGSEKVPDAAFVDIHGRTGNECITFETIASILGPALDRHFRDPAIRIIAEPGRFYVAPAFTLAAAITSRRAVYPDPPLPSVHGAGADARSLPISLPATTTIPTTTVPSTTLLDDSIPRIIRQLSRRTHSLGEILLSPRAAASSVEPSTILANFSDGDHQNDTDNKSFMYYINDGVYGSFNCLLFDHAQAFPKVLSAKNRAVHNQDLAWLGSWYECSVWGPTCDSMDCISKTARLPELEIGDWLYFEDMGAYTVAAASRFNGFELSRTYYTNTQTS